MFSSPCGRWDEGFAFGGEDIDLCLRVGRSRSVVYLPDVELTHYGRVSSRENIAFADTHLPAGHVRLLRKIGTPPAALLWLQAVSDLRRAALVPGEMVAICLAAARRPEAKSGPQPAGRPRRCGASSPGIGPFLAGVTLRPTCTRLRRGSRWRCAVGLTDRTSSLPQFSRYCASAGNSFDLRLQELLRASAPAPAPDPARISPVSTRVRRNTK